MSNFKPGTVQKNPSLIVRQLEADILTTSRGNSILILSCFFKLSKYISECWPR